MSMRWEILRLKRALSWIFTERKQKHIRQNKRMQRSVQHIHRQNISTSLSQNTVYNYALLGAGTHTYI